MIACSTLWNANRHDDGTTLAIEIKTLGINAVEINYTVTESMLDDIAALAARGEIRITSLHNFVPVPSHVSKERGSGDLFLLSSTNEDERQEAVAYTWVTIEHASRLGAQVVVLHLGKTGVDVTEQLKLERQLKKLIESGCRTQTDIDQLKTEMIHRRQADGDSHLEAALRSLDELQVCAEQHGVRLGIENRAHFCEIPSFEEIGTILDRYRNGCVDYWHDVGHARVFENLGLVVQQRLLECYGSRLVGIHLHDCRINHDHLAPGMGQIRFEKISPYLTPATIKVLEVNSRVSAKEIRQGISCLEERGIS